MVYVPVELEFDFQNTGTFNIPANDQVETLWPEPEGYHLVSWGLINTNSDVVRVNQAYITLVDDIPTFVGTLSNDDSVQHSARWLFVLLKKN